MKKRHTSRHTTTDTPDLQRRRFNKLLAAMTVLGTGLGVNMKEAFATDKRPPADKIKWEKEAAKRPEVQQFKSKLPARPGSIQAKPVPATKPGADIVKVPTSPAPAQSKTLPAKPDAEYGKITRKPGATAGKFYKKPGVTQAKPIPARPDAGYGKVEARPGADMLKGEVKPPADMGKVEQPGANMLKGETQGMEPLDKAPPQSPGKGFVPN